jgi:multiple antibiotic resistance protein
VTAAVLLFVLLLTAITLFLAAPLHRLLGHTGESVLIRVLGLILAALAAEQIIAGVEALMRPQ